MTTDRRPYRHVGEPVHIDGVPFGATYNDGDFYVASGPFSPGDIDLLAEIERLTSHSVLLNQVGWQIADALGGIADGATVYDGDVLVDVAGLITQRDVLRQQRDKAEQIATERGEALDEAEQHGLAPPLPASAIEAAERAVGASARMITRQALQDTIRDLLGVVRDLQGRLGGRV